MKAENNSTGISVTSMLLALILIVIVALTSCQKITLRDKYYVPAGENSFIPLKMIELNKDKTLDEQFEFGREWLTCPLTTPGGFGLKLSALGLFDYHDGGMNFQAYPQGGKILLKARYYLPKHLREGNDNGLRVIESSATLVNINELIHTKLCAYQDTAYWYINDIEVAKVGIHFRPKYRTPPFLGCSGGGKWAVGTVHAVSNQDRELKNWKVK